MLTKNGDEIHLGKFVDKEGNWSYEQYVKMQEECNILKQNHSGPSIRKLKPVIKHIKNNIKDLKFGLCHGTRRGDEQKSFKQALNIDILGTEISKTANGIPNTIQWDFHDVKDEWIGNVCFIFSNSLDHSYDPVYALRQWIKCLKPGGIIYMQYGPDDMVNSVRKKYGSPIDSLPSINDADNFRASIDGYKEIVKLASNGKYVFEAPKELKIKENKYYIIMREK